MKNFYHLLRIKHYIKNFLIFLPLFFIDQDSSDTLLKNLSFTFLIFCIFASVIYIYNDLQDINFDKKHPIKRKNKPLVNGKISILNGYLILLVLIALGSISLFLKQNLINVILAYLIMNIFYTHYFKKIIILDLFILSSNYVLRILAGCVTLEVPLSSWMGITIFCGALFLSSLKRKQELFLYGTKSREVLKKYSVEGLKIIANISATLCVVFYCTYVISINDKLIITTPFVLYGIIRYNYLSDQKNFTDSPVDQIIKDKQNIILIITWLILIIISK